VLAGLHLRIQHRKGQESHPRFVARDAFQPKLGEAVPNPAPRFSHTPAAPRESPGLAETLETFGMAPERIARLAR